MFGVSGLHGHIRRNHWRSLLLFLGFVAAVEILALGAWLPTRLFAGYMAAIAGPEARPDDPLIWFMIGGLVVGALWFLLFLGQNVRKAREAVGFAPAAGQDERRLRRLVEPLAISVGLPTPRLAVVESAARNAFACGLTPREAVIVVTRGLIGALDDDELRAVLAHEIAHLRNGDTRLMAFAFAAQEAIQGLSRRFAPLMNGRSWLLLLLSPVHLLMLAALVVSSTFGAILAALSRLLISRAREFVADAEAVRLIKDAGPLIAALGKIEGVSALENAPAAIEAMLIDGASTGALATHPTIAERIAALRAHAGATIGDETIAGASTPALAPPAPAAPGAALAALGAIAASAFAAVRPAPPDPAVIAQRRAESARKLRWAGAIVAAIMLFNVASGLIGMMSLTRHAAPRAPDAAPACRDAPCPPGLRGGLP